MVKRKIKDKSIEKGISSPGASFGQAGIPAVSAEAFQSLMGRLSPEDSYELSIDVQAAFSAICTPISSGTIRHFLTDGSEITGGPLYDTFRSPCPYMSTPQWIFAQLSWYLLTGEIVLSRYELSQKKLSLVPLNPR